MTLWDAKMAKRASTNPAAKVKMQCHMFLTKSRYGWYYTLTSLEGHPSHPWTKKYEQFVELEKEAPAEG